jgi:hypothetical protein
MRTHGRLLLIQRRQTSRLPAPATSDLYILIDQVARLQIQVAAAEARAVARSTAPMTINPRRLIMGQTLCRYRDQSKEDDHDIPPLAD